MPLAIDRREREGILILALGDTLTMRPEDATFRAPVQRCMAAGQIKIILDCGRLRRIDGAGLGGLFHVKLRRAGGRLVLLNIGRTQDSFAHLGHSGGRSGSFAATQKRG